MKISKALGFVLPLCLVGSFAHAAFDMGKLQSLNGRSGQGTNAYEKGNFACTVEVSKEDNALSIVQRDAYASTMLILGDFVEKAEQQGSAVVLQTNSSNPSKSGLCGDFMSARGLVTVAKVSKDEVTIAMSYRCGLIPKRNIDTFTCKLK
ncbi:hypothetical protein [Bdellovibrio svalbardensis]|uniref:Uncharacterized protein n=1 Tax=Bdellovibrio svalbardensis TaxID=2972972 RepID=A0ABT6DM10_9BACT|nr:hypothetical protein [Bdellovibrio svalbardensis]MDG0817686.1 hypothetical protein [Bdellovibrio svalbardensis]